MINVNYTADVPPHPRPLRRYTIHLTRRRPGFTDTLGPDKSDPLRLKSIPLLVLTSIWPAVAALLFFLIVSYIVLFILSEPKAVWFYVLAAVLFVLSQLAWFFVGEGCM
ncbi:hypothetical protein D9758_012463 [Tetrapyrgos nigripes]|uniref:Uncharacterized protein n=1 Tax=Tetrapyrgos nigripes TaxID=182062 RepID=A0A8H5FV88_9AGAR|nr:hypothetical protein D9758_012463 [Tetrapyrgos nigripes]